MNNIELSNVVNTALLLENKRRQPPFDKNGNSLNFASSNEEYCNYLIKHGHIILTELQKRLDIS